MTSIFDDSKSKLAWADKRFDDLGLEIQKFVHLRPYEEVIEPHPDKPDHEVRKIKLTRPIPPDIAHITAEIVGSLRSALDAAAYAIAVASGKSSPKSAAFPFSGSARGMADALKGRCKDIPAQIQSLFCGFQPYPTGNQTLWVLNEICNTDKHKMVVPIGTGAYPYGASVNGTRYFEMPLEHKWDGAKNEMVLITLGPGAEFNYDFAFRFFIAFGEIQTIQGREVLATLLWIGHAVNSILDAIHEECHRIGLIK